MFGRLAVFFEKPGYGFIRRSDDVSADEIFVHVAEFPPEYRRGGSKTAKAGMLVEFVIGLRKGKAIARNVRPIETDAPASEGAVHAEA